VITVLKTTFLFIIGVDDILAKTQEDLDRIKSNSYFQRTKKPTTPVTDEVKSVTSPSSSAEATGLNDGTDKVKSWVGFGEGSKGLEEEEAEQELEELRREALKNRQVETPVESPVHPEEEQVTFELPEEEESTEHQEADEDIFDTAYVDVVTSGELKFAYVPDSPTLESAAGDDPFDTTSVEKIIGPVVVPKPKKQLVSIGAAAQILSTTERPRRSVEPPKQLELFSFGDEDLPQASTSETSLPVEASGTDLFDLPNDETKPPTPPPAGTPDIKDILAEFDVIPETAEPIKEELFEKPVEENRPAANNPPVVSEPAPLIDEEDFEFEALALESLSKNQPDDWEIQAEEDDPFDTSCVDKVLQLPPEPVKKPSRPARPTAPTRPVIPAKSPIDLTDSTNFVSDDPFDTSQVKEQLSVHCIPERPNSPAPPERPKSPAPPGRPKSPAPPERPKSPAPPARPKSPALPARPISPAPPARPLSSTPLHEPISSTPTVEPSIPFKAQDSFDAAFLSDEGEVDPFDTSAVDHLVSNTTVDPPVSVLEPVTPLSFLDPDDLVVEENDPFDTSAVVIN